MANTQPVTEVTAQDFHRAPVKTEWGAGMLLATIAIDKNSCFDIYVDEDDLAKFLALKTIKLKVNP